MKTTIGINDKHLQSVATLLNVLLADEFILYTKTRNYHWNVEGPGFMELHKFFEGQYQALDEITDSVAERIRTLGHFAIGSMKDFTALGRLNDKEKNADTAEKMIRILLNDHETVARSLRNDITLVNDKYKDVGTGDFLTGLLQEHEKMAWMLRSYLS